MGASRCLCSLELEWPNSSPALFFLFVGGEGEHLSLGFPFGRELKDAAGAAFVPEISLATMGA